MDIKIETGRRLKEARLKRKLKLREVCEQIPGLEKTTLSNWENGIRLVSIEDAKKLAEVYKVSAAYLLTLEDAQTQKEKVLLEYYRACDERGQATVLRAAELERGYANESDDAACG
jgi:transcriptional regulator with XRE-family HTH domain